MKNLLHRIRVLLWTWGLRYPERPGWLNLAREFVSVPLWQKGGVFGLPLEYTLLTREDSGRIVPYEETCLWSGARIEGSTPLVPGPEGLVHDLSHWGVRCARCGVPIHSKHAGMRFGNDIPSCPPCRRAVQRVKRGG